MNTLKANENSKSIKNKIENIKRLKSHLDCKANQAHSLKETAMEHSLMADKILKNHH